MENQAELDLDKIPILDDYVSSAMNHWTHRFIAAGVPLYDFQMISVGVFEWKDWRKVWSKQAALHEELGKGALGQGRHLTAGEHLQRAALLFHFAKFLFVNDMEQLKITHEKSLACHRLALPHLDPPGERVEIPFEVGKVFYGNLRKPKDTGSSETKPPIVIMCSGIDGCKEELGIQEMSFLRRGVATLSFDGPGQGEAEYDLPLRPDFEVAVAAVIDCIQRRDDIDGQKIGVWGLGMGGHFAVRSAIADKRIKACISISGAFDYGTDFTHLPVLLQDAFRQRTYCTGDDEARAYARKFNLALLDKRITCPLLVLAGDQDEITPPENSEQIMSLADGLSRFLLILDGGHAVDNRRYSYDGQTSDWMAEILRI